MNPFLRLTAVLTAALFAVTAFASPASAAVPDAPGQPSVAVGSGQIIVSFGAPFDGGSVITGYSATCTSSDGGAPGTNVGASSPITVSSLTNGKTYTCKVFATNADGDGPESPASGAVEPFTVPDAPAPPTLTTGDGEIAVAFAEPFDGGSAITGYSATCTSSDGGAPGTNLGASSPITVSSLTNTKTYTCTVAASNIAGAGPASAASAPSVLQTVPDAPGKPSASAGNASVTVSFIGPPNGGSAITGYTATCTSSNGGASGTNVGPSSPITVSSLSTGKTYTCTVFATNGVGNGGPSPASDPVTTNSTPAAPSAPDVVAGNGSITVSFEAPVDDGGTPITGYTAACASTNGGVSRSASGTSSPLLVTALSNGKSYRCTARASNINGNGTPSAPSATVIPSTVPSAPARPTVKSANWKITVSFKAPFNGGKPITSYTATCTSSNNGVKRSQSRAASPIVVTGLTNGKNYTCKVKAKNGNGTSASSSASPRVVPSTRGFRLFSGDGGVFVFGEATFYGSAVGMTSSTVIAMSSTPDDRGYWMVDNTGRVFAFGNANNYGSPVGRTSSITGFAPTPSGKGYWLVDAAGSVYAYGDAGFHGGANTFAHGTFIMGIAPTRTGNGYWLVGANGGVYSFGDAPFYGSAVNQSSAPIMGISATKSGAGYRLAAADGRVFSFGAATALGSVAISNLRLPVAGIAVTGSGRGYWVASGDGGVFAFGDAPFFKWSGPLVLRRTIRGVSR